MCVEGLSVGGLGQSVEDGHLPLGCGGEVVAQRGLPEAHGSGAGVVRAVLCLGGDVNGDVWLEQPVHEEPAWMKNW